MCLGDTLDDASDKKGGVVGGVWKGEADFDEPADEVDLTTGCEMEFFGDGIFDFAVKVGEITSFFLAAADKFPCGVELATDSVSMP